MFLDLVICWFKLLLKLLQFLKISNFYTVFPKKLYSFSVFYNVFAKNRIKMFLKISINSYNGFFQKP